MRRLLLCVLLATAGCGSSGAGNTPTAGTDAGLLRVAVPGDPFAVAMAPDGSVWTATHDGKQVLRVDPVTHRVTASTSIAGNGTALAWAGGSMWAVGWKRALYRLDAITANLTKTISLPRPDQMAADGDRLWVTNYQHNSVSQVDAHAGKPLGTITAGPAPSGGAQGVSAVAVGGGSLWAVRGDLNTVSRIDPADGRIQATIDVGAAPVAAVFGAGALWVLDFAGNSVSRIDPATNRVAATINTQSEPAYAAVAGGAVWVTNFGGDSLTRIDPATNHTRQLRVCTGPAGVAADAHALWVACPGDRELVRVPA